MEARIKLRMIWELTFTNFKPSHFVYVSPCIEIYEENFLSTEKKNQITNHRIFWFSILNIDEAIIGPLDKEIEKFKKI